MVMSSVVLRNLVKAPSTRRVPSTGAIADETPDSLVERLRHLVGMLEEKGIASGVLWERCLLTPSCGTGSLPPASAEKGLGTLAEVSRVLRDKP